MKMQSYTVLGVMSGTSLDGVDLALIEFRKNSRWAFEILTAETRAYPPGWTDRLQRAMLLDESGLETLDLEYTSLLGGMIADFLSKHHVHTLDAVCSHGHTVFHQPEKGVTVQIGNRPELAGIIGQKVVCDFRVQDVRLGGQGAPLVPIGDRLLFDNYNYCLNLGGFANVSMEVSGERRAHDICAVNTVLNHYARKLGKAYDQGGELARAGEVNLNLLKALNKLPFYKMRAPKSLGMEWVEEEIFPLIDALERDPQTVLATYTLHVPEILAAEFRDGGRLLVTGGGAYNSWLMKLLRERTSVEVVIPEKDIVEYKEALIFALLGVLRLREEHNCLSSVTGASKDHSSGVIFNI